MFKNYFPARHFVKTAWRNLLGYKANSFINIAGLIVGFTSFLLIFLVVQYEQSFDDFHPNKNNIYRIVRNGKNSVNREYNTGVPLPLTSGLRREIPGLVNAAAIYKISTAQINITVPDGSVIKKFKERNGVFIAEPNFFQMFNFKLAEGNIKDAIDKPGRSVTK
ncbi:MAG TPA: ABC transporter permease [Parafilimonas sp.]|nr:ABC transporter permease [Parafilimonas sp.]